MFIVTHWGVIHVPRGLHHVWGGVVAARVEDELQSNGEPLWDACLAFATHDGEWASLVQPAADHWDELLDYTVDEGGVGDCATVPAGCQGRAIDDDYYTKPGAVSR